MGGFNGLSWAQADLGYSGKNNINLDIYFIPQKTAYRSGVIGFTGSFARSPPEQNIENRNIWQTNIL